MNFLGKKLLWLLKSSILSNKIVISTKREGILIFTSCITAKKCGKVQWHFASLQMHGIHAHLKYISTKMDLHLHIATCYHKLQLATCDPTSQDMLYKMFQVADASRWQCEYKKVFYPILHELKNAYNQRYITSYFLWFGPQISTIPYRGVQYVTIVYFVCTLCTVKVFIYKSRGEIFL